MIQPLENEHANDMPLLGHPFLAATYLMVNDDNDTFTLWQSNPTLESKLITAQPLCGSQDASGPPSNTKPGPSGLAKPSLSKGAIVGIAIGVITAAAAIAGGVFWLHAISRRLSRHDRDRRSEPGYCKAELPNSPIELVVHELKGPDSDTRDPHALGKASSRGFLGGELAADPVPTSTIQDAR
jgi:hypothetical protein